tara:strand:- start:2790 stop:3092 length:303 start_codon:yes stop_codon:yes gene_type:complete
MKLRLHWAEKYEVVREYPSFELDSKEFPELELEMIQVHNARSQQERSIALADLEHKMHQTESQGETIFSMVGPSDCPADHVVVYNVGDEDCGCFELTEEE